MAPFIQARLAKTAAQAIGWCVDLECGSGVSTRMWFGPP